MFTPRPERSADRSLAYLSALKTVTIRIGTASIVVAAMGTAAGGLSQAPQYHLTVVDDRPQEIARFENQGPPLWAPQEPHALRFELEQVFGVASEPVAAVLGRIADLAVDDRNRVFVLDRQGNRVVAFGPQGDVLWRSGGRGGGPGELDVPSSIKWDGDSSLFLMNGRGARLERWSVDGDFVESRALSQFGVRGATIAGVLSPTVIVVRSPSPGEAGARITVFEWAAEALSVRAEFTPVVLEPLSVEQTTAVVPVRVTGAQIALGEIDSYDLRFFDPSGELVWTVSRSDHPLVGLVDSRSPSSWLWPPLFLPSGHFISYLTTQVAENRWQSFVDLFDAEGHFLYTREWDGPEWLDLGRPNLVDQDGRLYSVRQDPFPHVRRYRVVIDPS